MEQQEQVVKALERIEALIKQQTKEMQVHLRDLINAVRQIPKQ